MSGAMLKVFLSIIRQQKQRKRTDHSNEMLTWIKKSIMLYLVLSIEPVNQV